ncbi:unnamed protein product [Adineta steineri]|uniref:RNA-dependent RNA polymerase n=1 Tax=Adineta steineri TaxID=433720 RepID=A0A814C469_9BILA|nr:unnamed protein product [Adineta steineri]CAF0971604.1 unnamed protein product [Adineta steineri]
MMRDLRDSIDQFSGSTVKVENELKQRNVNWLNKGIVNSLADWSALDFDPLEEQALLHENSISLVNNDSTVPNSIDVSNLKIAGKCFQYLTTTSSGVYKNMHIYSVLTYENVQKKMFSDKLLHKHIGYELKLALRMGLWFTPSVSMNLKKVKVRKKDDIEKHTDGCGRISIPVAREMSTRWKEGRKYKNVPFSAQSIGPTAWNSGTFQDSEIEYDETVQQPEYYSAFQVRLDGFKGMLVVDQSLGSKRIIKPSPSQEKFMSPEIQGRWSYKSIEMVQCSQPMVGARLNLALISLIVSCAKDSKDMQAYITGLAIDDLKKRLNKQNRKDAIEFSIKHNDVKSFNMLGAGCPLLETFLAGYYQNYMRRFKIVVEKSRRLFGVADFWHVLTSGEVFVQVSNLKEFSKQKVLVTKEPCFHRGDLRTFTTVTLQDLEKRKNGRCLTGLKDVIVFSCCKHEPPEPEKICGSDLDGDQYFVCWDQNIVGKLRDPLYDASNFDPTKKENLEKVYSSKVTNVAKNLIQREKHYAENIPSESTSSIFKLSSDEEKLLRYHHQPANEFENDVEERKYRLEKCNNLDEVSKVNVIEKSEELDIVTTLMHHKAAMNATNIADNPVLFSVQDIFDIHMRIMDNLKAEWTTDENWKLMEQLCQIIAIVVDSAKSNVMTFKKPVLEDLHLNELPKNPHYDPSKRKNDCKYSSSPLGQIYDALQRELRNDLLGHLQLSDHIDSTDQINHNTLYDEICELKLSFLLHYTKRQYHSDTETLGTNFDESFNTQHQNSDTENHVFNTSLQSIIPRLHIKDIYKWYENEVKPLTNTSLLKKEAACTMLWKVIMLSSLTARSSSRLQIFYLNEQESLIDVGLENVINSIDINCPFLCITQDLYEDLQQISSESFRFPNISSGTFFTIEQHHTALLIERLSILIEKTFWRDLKLPYPDCARLTRLINKDSKLSPVTFDETHSLFEMYSQECLQKPVITGTLITDPSGMDSDDDDNNNHNGNSSLLPNLQEIDICKPNNPPAYVLSKLRDILGCLLCFRETWSSTQSQNCRSALCEKIADISFHQIQMCKYQKVLQEVRDTWESCNKLENLPRCTWNRGRINLSKLEEADTLMQELFKLFLNDVTAETI